MRRLTAISMAVLLSTAGCAADVPTPEASPSKVTATESSTPSPTAVFPVGFFIPDDCLDVVSQQHLEEFASQGMALAYGPGSGSTSAFDRFPVEDETTDIWCIWATPSFDASVEIDIGPVTAAVRPAIIDFLDIQYMTTETEGDVVRYFLADDFGLDLAGRVDMVGSEAWIEVQVYPGGPAAFESAKTILAEVEAFTNAR